LTLNSFGYLRLVIGCIVRRIGLYSKYFAYITVFKINIFFLTPPPRAMLIFQAFMTAPLAKRSPSFKIVFLAIDGTYYEAIMTQVSALVIL